MKPRIIAFYLPQFHPFKENDEWWGKGFTEWTNVGKARSLFKGHNQPRVPTELGYYDLRLPIIREQQAQMAREAGIEGFCYWHYWFGNGKRLIPEVFDDVLKTGKPDFPFCLGWANHSWYAKNWNSDGTTTNRLLMEQTYPGMHDEKMHFSFLLQAFQDNRYIKINGAPILYIFDPIRLPEEYLQDFRKWTIEAGFPDLYVVANITTHLANQDDLIKKGYSAVTYQRLGDLDIEDASLEGKLKRKIRQKFKSIIHFFKHRPPRMYDYSLCYHKLVTAREKEENVIPQLLPQWDHSPRSGWNGEILINCNPDIFYLHTKEVLDITKNKENKLIFLKSWNEWGEGNMMEPDITYGRGFIDALRRAIDESGEY